MDGENNGKPYEQMDDLGGTPNFWKPLKKYTKKTKLRKHLDFSHQNLIGLGGSQMLRNFDLLAPMFFSVSTACKKVGTSSEIPN